MALNFTFTPSVAQGQDSLGTTIYSSGVDGKTFQSLDTLYSGLQSGISIAFDPTKLLHFQLSQDTGFNRYVVYGWSGSITFDRATSGSQFMWTSGLGVSGNPFTICSGNITGMSVQQLSGFSSGTITLMALYNNPTP